MMQKRITMTTETRDRTRQAKDVLNDFKDILKYFAPYIIFETLRNNPSIGDDLFAISLEVTFLLYLQAFAHSGVELSKLGTLVQKAIKKSPAEHIANMVARISLFSESKLAYGSMMTENNSHVNDNREDEIRSKI